MKKMVGSKDSVLNYLFNYIFRITDELFSGIYLFKKTVLTIV
jgi:hypothetical protein